MSGIFFIGGELEVNCFGYGVMCVIGDGVWGDFVDCEGLLVILWVLFGFGVNLIDIVDFYGLVVSEEFICEVLYFYFGLVVVIKGGLICIGFNVWFFCGCFEYFI